MRAVIKYQHKPKKKLHAADFLQMMYRLSDDEVEGAYVNRIGMITYDSWLNDRLEMWLAPSIFDMTDIRDNDDWDHVLGASEIDVKPLSLPRQLQIETGSSAETLMIIWAYVTLILQLLKLLGGRVSEDGGKKWQKRSEFKEKYQPILSLSRTEVVQISALEELNFIPE